MIDLVRHRILSTLLLVLISTISFSQTIPDTSLRICLTDYMTEKNRHLFPVVNENTRGISDVEGLEYYIVPVVFHIIHLNGEENIPDSKVIEQIKIMNEDFGHYGYYNQDSRGADTKIRFCLAKKDPFGNPTSGIIRIQDSLTNMKADNEMDLKNLSLWDQKRFLNIWIVRSIDGSSSTQGYSYLPSNSGGPDFAGDGIVINYKYVGFRPVYSSRYNLGRTITHEEGHYFDLLHTWGHDNLGTCKDDDGIDDTPVCSLEYYSSKKNGCPHPYQCQTYRLIEDFMDYSDDTCMKLFTKGQGAWMRQAISTYRSALVSYQNVVDCGCGTIFDSLNTYLDLDIYPVPSGAFIRFGTHSNIPYTLSYKLVDIYGHYIANEEFLNITRGIKEVNISTLKPGIYILQATYAGKSYTKKIVSY